MFAMGRIMTKAQVVAASWLRDSTLSVDGEAPFSHFLPARPSSSAIGPHCAIFRQVHMSLDPHDLRPTWRSSRATFDSRVSRPILLSCHMSLGVNAA